MNMGAWYSGIRNNMHMDMADQTCQSYHMLPCHASCLVEDRFSICEEYIDQAEIPQWALITTLLQRPVESISSLEDLLSYVQYDLQFATLRSTLQIICTKNPNFFACVWPNMVAAALSLPRLFPDGMLQTLQQRIESSVSLSREQIASLLVHVSLLPTTTKVEQILGQFWYMVQFRLSSN
jgi:hypothetical protein